MLTSIFIVAALIIVVATLWFFGQKPATHRNITPKKLRTLLQVLLNQGHDGGVLLIRGRHQIPFVQTTKYTGRQGVGLQLDFPRAPWAEPLISRVKASLESYHPLVTRGWTEQSNDLEFLTVDFGTDIERAAVCITDLAENVLGIHLMTQGRAQLMKVSADPHAKIGFEGAADPRDKSLRGKANSE